MNLRRTRRQKMNKYLNSVIQEIEDDYRELIQADGRNYIEVSISDKAQEMGFSDIEASYRYATAIVPIKQPVDGMKVRIDGRTFVNYHQFLSGVAVPHYVSKATGFDHRPYKAQNSMICNFN
jgi:hypothetical protein